MLAGSGSIGSLDGAGTTASFGGPAGLAFASDNSLLVGDSTNNKVRRIVISNFSAFDGAGLSTPTGSVSVGSPDTYVANADGNNYPAFVSQGVLNPGSSVNLNPWAFALSAGVTSFQFVVTVDGGTSFDAILDAVNFSTGQGSPTDYVRTLTRPQATGSNPSILTGRLADVSTSSFLYPCFASDGTAYMATNSQILRVDTGGNVTVIAGALSGNGISDGTGQSAGFDSIKGLTCTPDGSTLYVADQYAVRRVTGHGPNSIDWTVTTVAGLANTSGFVRGVGNVARFGIITGIGVSPNGQNIYVTDSSNYTVTAITLIAGNYPSLASSWFVVDLGGNGFSGFADGSTNVSRFGYLYGLAVTPLGDILVSDNGNCLIRKVTTGGLTSTYTGSGIPGYADGPSGSAKLQPTSIAVGPSGYVYFADGNKSLRRVSPTGEVSTVGSTSGTTRDGNLASSSLGGCYTVAVSPTGTVWYDSNNALRSVERIVGL